jgi:diadenosine tetraphosphate (Ap4A) HIT family hydrolase
MTPCKTCELIARRDAGSASPWDRIYRTVYWDVAHAFDTSLPGWFVLVARRHIESLDELTKTEAIEMGSLIRAISIALKLVMGCAKTYALQLAESADHPHVHYHIIPISADMPNERRSMNIFSSLGVPEAERVSEAEMNEIASKVGEILRAEYA